MGIARVVVKFGTKLREREWNKGEFELIPETFKYLQNNFPLQSLMVKGIGINKSQGVSQELALWYWKLSVHLWAVIKHI